ncbi:hypothetical protein BDR05DRAFT_885338, partial [Suillus weaverae]
PYQRHRGAQTICSDFQQLYYNETGKSVKLSHSTLIRLAAGGMSKAQSNTRLTWLTDEETDIVIHYIIEMGNHGFPLSYWRLKEHVDEICHAWLGSFFLEKGVGINWTH